MSDSESEQFTATEVITNLKHALVELEETSDYLSYATLIDLYISDPTIYSDKDKALILEALAKILEENTDIVREIGWDLPQLLLGFLDMEWDYKGSLLRTTDLVKLIMKNFDILSKNGNSKELFIKAIELLADIDFSESDDPFRADKIRDIKIHTLVELLTASLRRIKTIYPSKFLGMASTSLLKLLASYVDNITHPRIIIRRLYTFARDYIPPREPEGYKEEHNITDEEAKKIKDDEIYLQSILLQSFLTHLISIPLKLYTVQYALELYRDLQDIKKGIHPQVKAEETSEDTLNSVKGLIDRIYNLEVSYDIDIFEEFEKLKASSIELFEPKADTKHEAKSDDEKVQDLIKYSVNDRIANLVHPEATTLALSNSGILISSAAASLAGNQNLQLTPKEAILISIRFLSPSLLSERFKHFGILDAVTFWGWKAINNATNSDFKDIPHYQLILYLQILISFSATTSDPQYRLVIFTLLTRVLSLLDEDVNYNFIIDTLTTAPFENVKSGMIHILKDMILRRRCSSVDDITIGLKEAEIKSDKKDSENKAPALPPRNYIVLNKDRIEDIYVLIREAIEESFGQDSKGFLTLLSYLNFLIGIKGKFPVEKVQSIVKVSNEKIEDYKKDYKKEFGGSDSSTLELLSLSLETLEETFHK